MVVVPLATAVTLPLPSTVAAAVLVLLQVPPPAASLSAMAEPIHTADGPLMVPATGNGLTVTVVVVVALLQPVVTV